MMSCESNQDTLGLTAVWYSGEEGGILCCILHNYYMPVFFIIYPNNLKYFELVLGK